MNYLAHAFLSFNQPDILVGNMVSDFVKGKKQFDYSTEVQKGIQLHRAIDNFTDTHEVTKQAKQFLKPAVGAYAGAFMDVVYDHFLAIDTNQFANPELLQSFTSNTYRVLQEHETILPEKFKTILPYMIQHDWLYNYQFNWGIQKSFEGVARRAKYLTTSATCFQLFEFHYEALKISYHSFFPELKKFAAQFLAGSPN